MQDQKIQPIGFWLTCFIIVTGLLAVMIVDGNAWATSSGMKMTGLILAALAGVVYFVWRGRLSRAYLVRTDLEWVYALTLLALFGAWILSADPRQGLSRISLLIGYILLFYILADAMEVGLDRDGVLAGLLLASGIVLIMAVLETCTAYTQWWEAVGSRQVMPPHPYRLISLAGNSDAMMGLVNMCAPLALLSVFRKKKFVQRVLLIIWLTMYVILIPFSLSQGGWIGISAWLGVIFFYWLWMQERFQQRHRGKKITIFSGLVALGAVEICLVYALTNFAQDSLMGETWKNAFKIWLANPAFGVGPGQFGIGILRTVNSIPPGYWALNAHSLPLQILAEFGVAGGIAMLALLVENSRWFWKRFSVIEEDNRWVGAAVIAGVAAWGAQMLVDDQTGVAVVMVALIMLLAYFVSLPGTPLKRWPQVSQNIIILPGLMLMIGAGWGMWAYSPMEKGTDRLASEDCTAAATLFRESMGRDPNFSFYATQAGFAWAECGMQEKDDASLMNAHQAFDRSVEIEPDVSLVWANMAVADWQTPHFHEKAIPNMQHAIALSPHEASYLLNLGWFYEQEEFHEQAVSAYVKTLEQEPGWAEHPFWQLTEVRKEALAAWSGKLEMRDTMKSYWMQAREAIDGGYTSEAETLLAKAGWTGEPALAVLTTHGMLSEAQHDRQGVIAAYEKVAEAVQQRSLNSSHEFMLTYTVGLNHRQGITDDFVPGYLQLNTDYGQFAALEKLYSLYAENGECDKASAVWLVWQQAVHGGAPEVLPLKPDC